jgi:hypothetical protein
MRRGGAGYGICMGRGNDPWQQIAMLGGVAALAGAGVGASSALMFAERRAAAQDRELESLSRRVTLLERLHDRVTRLETGSSQPAVERRAS